MLSKAHIRYLETRVFQILFILGGEFQTPGYAKIFEVIAYLSVRGKSIDLVTVADELHKRGIYEEIGGDEALVKLISFR